MASTIGVAGGMDDPVHLFGQFDKIQHILLDQLDVLARRQLRRALGKQRGPVDSNSKADSEPVVIVEIGDHLRHPGSHEPGSAGDEHDAALEPVMPRGALAQHAETILADHFPQGPFMPHSLSVACRFRGRFVANCWRPSRMMSSCPATIFRRPSSKNTSRGSTWILLGDPVDVLGERRKDSGHAADDADGLDGGNRRNDFPFGQVAQVEDLYRSTPVEIPIFSRTAARTSSCVFPRQARTRVPCRR